MADLSDVLNVLVGMVEQAVYPNGTSQPSVAGVDVSIFPGWPIRNKLDDEMKAGRAMISVYPTNKEKDVTKFERVFQEVESIPATITATVVGNVITFGGVISVPQAVMIVVDGVGYSYQVLITDTLDDIATALSLLVPGSVPSGSTLTIDFNNSLVARIVTQSKAAEELGRQERVFQISCWCNNPTTRSLLAPPIDIFFRLNYRFVLPDGFYCHMFYDHTNETDDLEIPLIYRRDLFFRVQYATTNTQLFTTIASNVLNVEYGT
jgi:hypothetical protein